MKRAEKFWHFPPSSQKNHLSKKVVGESFLHSYERIVSYSESPKKNLKREGITNLRIYQY